MKHGKRVQEEQTKRKKQTSEVEQQPRKKKKRLTMTQYINKNGKRTRKQLQQTSYDANNSDTMNDTGKQNTNRPKETNKRPRIETDRTNRHRIIGKLVKPWGTASKAGSQKALYPRNDRIAP